MRAVMVGAALAMGLLLAPAALAQPAEAPHGSPEMPGRVTPPANGDHGGGHGGGHGDPSKHFNYLGGPFEHSGKDVVGGPLGDDKMIDPHTGKVVLDSHGRPYEEPMSAPFIFMILNFVILLAVLAKWGGPAARKMAAERHDQIKTALDEAAKLRTQAADKLAEYEARLKAADDEIAKLVAGMRADAEADKKRILETAERQAAQMKRDAELHIAAEIALARAALTREVTAAATAAAEQILREKMTPGDQQKLVGAFIGELQSGTQKEAR